MNNKKKNLLFNIFCIVTILLGGFQMAYFKGILPVLGFAIIFAVMIGVSIVEDKK